MGNFKSDKREKQKLSWIYRQKKRKQRSKRSTNNDTQIHNNEKARIMIRNLPFQVKEEDIKKFYEGFGPIEEINLLKHPDGKPIGRGFVQFKRVADASKAIFKTNKTVFQGRTILSDWAISKSKFCEKLEKLKDENDTEENSQQKTEVDEPLAEVSTKTKKENNIDKQEKRRLQKLQKKRKRARIIVRNLAFNVTDDDLKEHFAQYGEIEEVVILKTEDGLRVGCGFVQFERVQSAAKAIHYGNLQPLCDRKIVVDWAMPKNKFSKEIKQEPITDADGNEVKIKEEVIDPDEAIAENNVENGNKLTDDSSSDSDEDSVLVDEVKSDVEEDSDTDEEKSSEDEKKDDSLIKSEYHNDENRPRKESHDVTEGRTVFLKNVPFSANNEELKACMEQFGPVFYALICVDPLTEHSRGTAFVKFRNVEDAEKCLAAGTELRLCGQILDSHRALHRHEIENKKAFGQKREKDSRNLYLVKEGVILAGSPAAAEVSAADMAKRLQMEQWKSQMLRNLNMFVSRNRLIIHNLPPTLDDAKLREIFKQHGAPKAVITEARVMRDLKNVDAKGVGKSKEHGFISFTSHEDALTALRNINNNPNIFSKHRRPIVAFSIENRVMVNAKRKRIENSKKRNPLYAGYEPKKKEEDEEPVKPASKRAKIEEPSETKSNTFSGVTSKPGKVKMRSKFNLKTQAAVHGKTLKKEKKMNKSVRAARQLRKEKEQARKEIRVKQGTKFDPDEANFTKIVNSYRDKMVSVGNKKSKWYST